MSNWRIQQCHLSEEHFDMGMARETLSFVFSHYHWNYCHLELEGTGTQALVKPRLEETPKYPQLAP